MGQRNDIGGVDFSAESFVVQSALFGTDYAIKTAAGEKLLRAERRFFDTQNEYVYKEDGEVVLRYDNVDEGTGDQFQLLDVKSGTVLGTLTQADSRFRWELDATQGGGGRARIVSEKGRLSFLYQGRGRSMEILATDGTTAGNVERRTLSTRLTFDVDVPGLDGVTRAAAVLAVPLLFDMMKGTSMGWEPDSN